MGVDLNDLLTSIDANSQTTRYLSEQSATKQQSIVDAILSMAAQIPNTYDIASVEASELAALETQNKKSDLYDSISTDGFNAFSKQLTQQLVSATTARNDIAKQIQDKESVGFFDDPLTFIMNQLELDDDYAKLQGADLSAKSASAGLQQLNTAMQQTAATEREYAKTKNEAAIQSKLSALKAEIDLKVAGATIDALRVDAQRIKTLMDADTHIMQNVSAQYTAEAMAEYRQAIAADRKEQDAEKELRIAERKLKLEAYTQLQLTKEQQAKLIQNAMVATGVPPEQAIRLVNAANVDNMLKQPGAVGKRFQTYLELGASQELDGTYLYGDSAVEAATVVDQLGIQPTNLVQKALVQNTKDASRSPNVAVIADKKTRLEATEQVAQSQMEKKRQLIDPADMSNPYQAPALSILVDQAAVKSSPLYVTVIEPLMRDGGLKTADTSLIVKHTTAAVDSGKLRVEDAATGLSMLYTTAVDYNNNVNKYKTFGYKNQNSFNVNLNLGFGGSAVAGLPFGSLVRPMFTSAQRVNMLDQTEVKRYLVGAVILNRGVAGNIDTDALFGVGDSALSPVFMGASGVK